MTVYINGVDTRSKVVWKDASEGVINDDDRTAWLDWTDLDITAETSPHAKFAILMLRLKAGTKGTGTSCELKVRKNGTTPSYCPQLKIRQETIEGQTYYRLVTVGLDSDRVLEYTLSVGTDWVLDTDVSVLGYIE
ncbi:hypothetical protein ES703_96743 [subsurface metagenome]